MTANRQLAAFCALAVLCSSVSLAAEAPENFRTENLVAWCIVPFDAKKRGPAERSAMLVELGLKRCAYDWRAEHVPSFEEEIEQYKEHGIEYFAFWGEHDAAFALFEKHKLAPQVWITLPSPEAQTPQERVSKAVAAMTPVAERTAGMNCKLGLYNHGGWGGEPANLVAVCKALHALGHKHVGVVYNFHHGHDHIDDFAHFFALMKPYLLCVNLNGMDEPGTEGFRKIAPIGSGKHEKAMIRTIIESGYDGPVGIIGHRTDEDVAVTLHRNIAGLEGILAELNTK